MRCMCQITDHRIQHHRVASAIGLVSCVFFFLLSFLCFLSISSRCFIECPFAPYSLIVSMFCRSLSRMKKKYVDRWDERLMSYARLIYKRHIEICERARMVGSTASSVYTSQAVDYTRICIRMRRRKSAKHSRSKHEHIYVWLNSKNVGFCIPLLVPGHFSHSTLLTNVVCFRFGSLGVYSNFYFANFAHILAGGGAAAVVVVVVVQCLNTRHRFAVFGFAHWPLRHATRKKYENKIFRPYFGVCVQPNWFELNNCCLWRIPWPHQKNRTNSPEMFCRFICTNGQWTPFALRRQSSGLPSFCKCDVSDVTSKCIQICQTHQSPIAAHSHCLCEFIYKYIYGNQFCEWREKKKNCE